MSGLGAWIDYTQPENTQAPNGTEFKGVSTNRKYILKEGDLIKITALIRQIRNGYQTNKAYEVVKGQVLKLEGQDCGDTSQYYFWIIYESNIFVKLHQPADAPPPSDQPPVPQPPTEQPIVIPDGVSIEVKARQTLVIDVKTTFNELHGGGGGSSLGSGTSIRNGQACDLKRENFISKNINVLLGESALTNGARPIPINISPPGDAVPKEYHHYRAYLPISSLINCNLNIEGKMNVYKRGIFRNGYNPYTSTSDTNFRPFSSLGVTSQIQLILATIRRIQEHVNDVRQGDAGRKIYGITQNINQNSSLGNETPLQTGNRDGIYVFRKGVDLYVEQNPKDTPAQIEVVVGQKFRVTYNTNASNIAELNRNEIQQIVGYIQGKAHRIKQIFINGHTDNRATTRPGGNQQLSIDRACDVLTELLNIPDFNSRFINEINSPCSELIQEGRISQDKRSIIIQSSSATQSNRFLVITWHRENDPIVPYENLQGEALEEARRKNRRVEVWVIWDYEQWNSIN